MTEYRYLRVNFRHSDSGYPIKEVDASTVIKACKAYAIDGQERLINVTTISEIEVWIFVSQISELAMSTPETRQRMMEINKDLDEEEASMRNPWDD
jgi:hypothetical protein